MTVNSEPPDPSARNSMSRNPLETARALDRTIRDTPLDFTRLLYMFYIDMDSKIRQADTKAQILLGINAILIASINNLTTQGSAQKLLTSGNAIEQVSVLSSLLVLGALVGSVFFALIVTAPRLTRNKARTDNVLYFSNISLYTRTEYLEQFLDLSLQEIKELVMGEIHAQANVVAKKYRMITFSLLFLFAGVILWAFSRLLLAFV